MDQLMSQSVISGFAEALIAHRDRLEPVTMKDRFAAEPNRFDEMSLKLGDLVFDFSRNRMDADCLATLLEMARASGIETLRDQMFAGGKINTTENRAALHTALRSGSGKPVMVDGKDVMPQINTVLARMAEFSEAVRDGTCPVSGGLVTDVVNIGIGGSDLGPAMVVEALAPCHDGPHCHFVSNVDAADIAGTLAKLDPQTTLFIIASKTFTTSETMANAKTAMQWMEDAVGKDAGRHFVALSTNPAATSAFGIPEERTFGFWDWVGGRYSVWSAAGLSVMIAIGSENFTRFLAGAHAADEHFRSAKLDGNIPVIMALLGIWYRNFWNAPAHAIVPYDNRLSRFPAYLQQLDMESNGKSVTRDGEPVAFDTGPVIFGEPGTNAQHAFFQLVHQGTEMIPCDFLVAACPHENETFASHHRLLLANCLAQGEALMTGRTLEEAEQELEASDLSGEEIRKLAPHRVFEGNRPSNTFLYKKLDPFMLGQLMALYEHKVFVQAAIWNINPFDQWGVELGKKLAGNIEPLLSSGNTKDAQNSSTAGLLKSVFGFRKT